MGVFQDLVGQAAFDDAAVQHDQRAVGQHADDAQVVADHQHADVEIAPDLLDEDVYKRQVMRSTAKPSGLSPLRFSNGGKSSDAATVSLPSLTNV